jgi:oxygen-independent coproporphyrinogen-3 oxidase
MPEAIDELVDYKAIPLSLYIHLPWCLHKCPYCDFNSHATQANQFPEQDYVSHLIQDLVHAKPWITDRPVNSIFIGGGTPSLFSPESIEVILSACKKHYQLNHDCEITLESNPGTFEYHKFSEFRACGVNRLSIGVQSFNEKLLQKLERIHSSEEALQAIATAKKIGFDNINIDLMFGLPDQSVKASMDDLQLACKQDVAHISFYNLTLEPNTVFHRFPPVLPTSEQCWQMQSRGIQLLQDAGYQRYEVSAYAKDGQQCRHNLNYWQYGDYLGVGAGAHSKISTAGGVVRFEKPKQPNSYMQSVAKYKHVLRERTLDQQELIFEFMLNSLRLITGFTPALFSAHTGLNWSIVDPIYKQLHAEGLLELRAKQIHTTELGYRFLDSVIERFLPQ